MGSNEITSDERKSVRLVNFSELRPTLDHQNQKEKLNLPIYIGCFSEGSRSENDGYDHKVIARIIHFGQLILETFFQFVDEDETHHDGQFS